jgi:transcriptional regulator with XRE-family HTH domain
MTSPDRTDPNYRRLVEQETLIADAQELVCELLEKAGMSRQELAVQLGKSKGFVSQLLSGERNMTLRTLADLAFATGYRIELSAAAEQAPKHYSRVTPGWRWTRDSIAAPSDVYSTMMRPLIGLGQADFYDSVDYAAPLRKDRCTAVGGWTGDSDRTAWIPAGK